MGASLETEKTAFRARFKAYRDGLTAAAYAQASAAIVARTAALPVWAQVRTVHVYWPMVARREVDVRPLLGRWHAAGLRLVLPVVTGFGPPGGAGPRLRAVVYDGADRLRPNRWGVHEPSEGKSVPIEEIDAVVVPALGADRRGHRLGHGGGYYDELLRDLPVPTVGLVYAACLVPALPAGPFDVPLSLVVTEHEVVHPAGGVTSPTGSRTAP